jgi:hypothetical protein
MKVRGQHIDQKDKDEEVERIEDPSENPGRDGKLPARWDLFELLRIRHR